MSTASAPLEIGRVALTVNDLAAVRDFYRTALGLEVLRGDEGVALLGAGDRAILELREDRSARRRSAREAGLFHTAFLLPSRDALGRWLRHAAESRLPLQGASDHLVSEAVYLADPEGNGIEVYADKPREAWPREGGEIKMDTLPMDVNGVAGSADGPWTGAPEGTVVGHVHLQVGNVAEAEEFYHGALGFDVMTHYPGAAFLGSGGYHHHLGANVWNSRGAGRRTYPSTGLADVEILADGSAMDALLTRTGGQRHLADPWGTSVTLNAKAA
ncbi:Glyoxalase family protein [Rubellimicrobium mesophilum DSM 19309]|uniref:Glyoxalase family protein n=1 Tax=Rubellimicrobium mesophilum DSM 19309 TaxID=442562 RepID=A0A017HL81_9RHOB|nr:VOC family protein [Rubellimicrobium mesophilum]EYD75272.1 Glyoxalase family protein [Rubellimicrobium mesophilum DSM 19309]